MRNLLTALGLCAATLIAGSVASASILTVEAAPPGIQQSQQGPCIIGDPSGSCDVLLSSNPAGGAEDKYSLNYEVSYITGLVGTTFGIGIDVNEASGAGVQMLDYFAMEYWNGVSWVVVDETNQAWELDDSVNNGNGVSDLIIKTFSLAGLAPTDLVRFYVELSSLSDGREQFLLLDLDDINEIPIPGAIWLMGAGLAGLGFAGRKKKKA